MNKIMNIRPEIAIAGAQRHTKSICLAGALGSLIFFMTCLASAEQDKKTSAEGKPISPNEYLKSFSQKVDISIMPAMSGIDAGLVIAYGHLVPRPYKFEYRANAIYVNNVQVDPSFVEARLRHESNKSQRPITPVVSQKYQELESFERALRKEFFNREGRISEDQLHAEILEIAQANPMIKDARWETPTRLGFKDTFSGSDVPTGIIFHKEYIHPPSPKIRTQQEINQIWQEKLIDYENEIKGDGCVFFTCLGPRRGMPHECRNIKSEVIQIMHQSNLSQEQREKRLTEFLGNDVSAAADIILNYNANEWK